VAKAVSVKDGGLEPVKKSVTVTSAEPETIQEQPILSSAVDCHLIFSISATGC
jgi:hypothetical protein